MIIGAYAIPTVGREGWPDAEKQDVRIRATRGLQRILKQDHGLDVLIAPEYTNIRLQDMLALSELAPGTLLIPGTSMVNENGRVSNRAHVLYGGKVIATHDKRFFRTSNGVHDADYMLQRGILRKGTTPGVFSHDGNRFGIEICYDHDQGVLRNDGVHDLDYQIIVGCGAVYIRNTSVTVKPQGTVILVDGERTALGAMPNTTVEVAGKRVHLAKRPIDAAPGDTLYVYAR